MKKSLLMLSLLALSCSGSDDGATENENLLTGGIWKKVRYENIHLHPDGTSDITINEENAGLETLEFKTSHDVTYHTPDWMTDVEGSWEFADGDQFLMTTLVREVDPSTGFGNINYFPNNLIDQLTQEQLVMVSDTTYWYDDISEPPTKTFRKYYFEH